MSHYGVAVITRGDGTGPDEDAIAELMLPYCEVTDYITDKGALEFVEDEDCDVDPETGRRGYWSNPNAKWDWYEVGGRFEGSLPLKGGGHADCAKVSDIDTSPDEEAYAAALEDWDKYANRGEHWLCKPEYFLSHYGDVETYAKAHSVFYTHAVVTPDGEWSEVGEMGWFGMSDEGADDTRKWVAEYKGRFIDPYMDGYEITFVDCHI